MLTGCCFGSTHGFCGHCEGGGGENEREERGELHFEDRVGWIDGEIGMAMVMVLKLV